MSDHHASFLGSLCRRTAQAAIGPSALRNQGAAGVVKAARDAAEHLDLRRYGRASRDSIPDLLNKDTGAMLKLFPRGAKSNWGAARKALNLFLRDATYNVDLSRHFGLAKVRPHLEVPLDKDVATKLLEQAEGQSLPRWRGVKNLEKQTSEQYQVVASKVARRFKVERVDLDVFFWRS